MSVSIFKITTQKVIDTLESDEIQALYLCYVKNISVI